MVSVIRNQHKHIAAWQEDVWRRTKEALAAAEAVEWAARTIQARAILARTTPAPVIQTTLAAPVEPQAKPARVEPVPTADTIPMSLPAALAARAASVEREAARADRAEARVPLAAPEAEVALPARPVRRARPVGTPEDRLERVAGRARPACRTKKTTGRTDLCAPFRQQPFSRPIV